MDPEPRSQAVWVGVLGPLALRVAGTEVPVPGTRRRTLLATLALARGRVVGVDRLVDTLWPDDLLRGRRRSAVQPRLAPAPRSENRRRTAGQAGCGLRPRAHRGQARRNGGPGRGRRTAAPCARSGARSGAGVGPLGGPALEEFRGHADLDIEAVALDELRRRLHDEVVQARVAVGHGSAVADASATVAADPLARGVSSC